MIWYGVEGGRGVAEGGSVWFFFFLSASSYFPHKSVINNSHVGRTWAHKQHLQISITSPANLPNTPNVSFPGLEFNIHMWDEMREGEEVTAAYAEVSSVFVPG